jgi:hypothetical protein
MILPKEWTPPAKMQRVICHWTAGRHKASAVDRKHYHFIIEGDGSLVRGDPSIKQNEAPAKTGYAAHTLNCNSGSIGVSVACMWNAKENPFSPGPAPMTEVQWKAMVALVAELCRRYRIPVTPKTVLSHAEVEKNLGIKQRGKWDFTRLAFDMTVVGADQCGAKLRGEVLAALGAPTEPEVKRDWHVVDKGDTWSSVAREHGISLVAVLSMNGAKESDILRIGRKLAVTHTAAQAVRAPKSAPAPAPTPAQQPAPAATPEPKHWFIRIIEAIFGARS